MKLTSENVEKIFTDCLFRNGENTDNTKYINGIINSFGFHLDRVKKHENDIYSMLKQLPENFQKDTGGGWSFLNACNNKDGEQWTGFHRIMEKLFVIGMACDKVQCLLPQSLWKALPGSMPYYVVL